MSDTLPLAPPKKPTRKATELERRKINRLLDSHLKRVSGTEDSPGECEYLDPSMCDAKIAEMVSLDLSPASVSNIRLQVFGRLHKEDAEAGKTAQLRAEIVAQFEDRLSSMKVHLDGVEERLKQMEGALLYLSTVHNQFVSHQFAGGKGRAPIEGAERFFAPIAWARRQE